MSGADAQAESAVTDVFREQAGRVTAALIRRFRDFDLAEESVQDALVAALETWPSEGVPERPTAWLTTVATRRALNRLDRDRRYREKLAEVAVPPRDDQDDDRLRLILTCCHPALSREAQVGLTLRAVVGFTTSEIARAFVAPEATIAQRLFRAKRKVAAAGIPYRIPSEAELGDRLTEVLDVLYLVFNEGHLATMGGAPSHRNLAEEAAWLAALLCRLLPNEPEPIGLLALMKLHLARGQSRFDAAGQMVLLAKQDRALWDRSLISDAIGLIERAASRARPGPYQLEAAIAACHAEAPSIDRTDWRQIVVLYDMLLTLAPSPVVRLNRAIAVWRVDGPEVALRNLDALTLDLDNYHLFHAARGEMLDELGRREQARAAQARSLDLTRNSAERALLERRLFSPGDTTMPTPEEGIQSQLRNIEKTYSRSIDELVADVAGSGLTKHSEVVAMLKLRHGMAHGAAHRVSLVARDRLAGAQSQVSAAPPASVQAAYEELLQTITALGEDIEQAPKKGYVSLRRRKQSRCCSPAPSG
jgi:RNA polymerase sigma-70 factor (ECF subfamily)